MNWKKLGVMVGLLGSLAVDNSAEALYRYDFTFSGYAGSAGSGYVEIQDAVLKNAPLFPSFNYGIPITAAHFVPITDFSDFWFSVWGFDFEYYRRLTCDDCVEGAVFDASGEFLSWQDADLGTAPDNSGDEIWFNSTPPGVGGATLRFLEYCAFQVTPCQPVGNRYFRWETSDGGTFSVTMSRIPEPTTLALLGIGLAGVRMGRGRG